MIHQGCSQLEVEGKDLCLLFMHSDIRYLKTLFHVPLKKIRCKQYGTTANQKGHDQNRRDH